MGCGLRHRHIEFSLQPPRPQSAPTWLHSAGPCFFSISGLRLKQGTRLVTRHSLRSKTGNTSHMRQDHTECPAWLGLDPKVPQTMPRKTPQRVSRGHPRSWRDLVTRMQRLQPCSCRHLRQSYQVSQLCVRRPAECNAACGESASTPRQIQAQRQPRVLHDQSTKCRGSAERGACFFACELNMPFHNYLGKPPLSHHHHVNTSAME